MCFPGSRNRCGKLVPVAGKLDVVRQAVINEAKIFMQGTIMKQNAFTLFEMLLALLLVVFASSFSVTFINNKHHQLKTYAKSFYHAFRLARVESIVLGESVAVAPYDGATHELATDWCKGWVMFKEPFAMDTILQSHVGIHSCAAIWRSFPARDHLTFLPLGMTKYQNASLTLQGDQLYKVYVSQTGRVRM